MPTRSGPELKKWGIFQCDVKAQVSASNFAVQNQNQTRGPQEPKHLVSESGRGCVAFLMPIVGSNFCPVPGAMHVTETSIPPTVRFKHPHIEARRCRLNPQSL